MDSELRRFLSYRFLALVGWVVLLLTGFELAMAVTSHVDDHVVRWVANTVTLFGSIRIGLLLQGRLLAHVDPDGRLRAQVAKLGADAED